MSYRNEASIKSISLETKKGVLNCYVISILLNGSECWTIPLQMKMSIKVHQNMLRIPGIEHVNSQQVFIRAPKSQENGTQGRSFRKAVQKLPKKGCGLSALQKFKAQANDPSSLPKERYCLERWLPGY